MNEFEKYVKKYFDGLEKLAYRSKIIRRTDDLLKRQVMLKEYGHELVKFKRDFKSLRWNDTVRAERIRRYGDKSRGPRFYFLVNILRWEV